MVMLELPVVSHIAHDPTSGTARCPVQCIVCSHCTVDCCPPPPPPSFHRTLSCAVHCLFTLYSAPCVQQARPFTAWPVTCFRHSALTSLPGPSLRGLRTLLLLMLGCAVQCPQVRSPSLSSLSPLSLSRTLTNILSPKLSVCLCSAHSLSSGSATSTTSSRWTASCSCSS